MEKNQSWYETFHYKDVDIMHPQTLEFKIYMTDFVYNKLLEMCDKHHMSPDEYINQAVISALKKEGEWI